MDIWPCQSDMIGFYHPAKFGSCQITDVSSEPTLFNFWWNTLTVNKIYVVNSRTDSTKNNYSKDTYILKNRDSDTSSVMQARTDCADGLHTTPHDRKISHTYISYQNRTSTHHWSNNTCSYWIKLMQHRMINALLPDSGLSRTRASWSKSSRVIYNGNHNFLITYKQK